LGGRCGHVGSGVDYNPGMDGFRGLLAGILVLCSEQPRNTRNTRKNSGG
jgi:hypothetical protein